VRFPSFDQLAEIIETAIQRLDIDGRREDPSEPDERIVLGKPIVSNP
jgi:hypothetical protein